MVPDRNKTYSDIAGNHVTDGLGLRSHAGNGWVKILLIKEIFYQISDTGSFMLQNEGGVMEMFQQLCTGKGMPAVSFYFLAIRMETGRSKYNFLLLKLDALPLVLLQRISGHKSKVNLPS